MVLGSEVAEGIEDGTDTVVVLAKQSNVNQTPPPFLSPQQDPEVLLRTCAVVPGSCSCQDPSKHRICSGHRETEGVTLHHASVSSQGGGQAGSSASEKTVKFCTECDLMAKPFHC